MPLPNIENHQHYPDLPTFVDAMYSIYSTDFLLNRTSFQSRSVHLRNSPSGNLHWKDYDWTFHHIITREDSSNPSVRILNIPRAVRIRFPRHYLDNESTLLVWMKRKGNEDKYYISDHNFDYLIILAKRKTSGNFVLLSAFPTDYDHYRKRLKREYQQCTGSS